MTELAEVLEICEADLIEQEDAAARGVPGAAEKAKVLRSILERNRRPPAAPAPKHYGKVRRTLEDFDKPDEWGNA